MPLIAGLDPAIQSRNTCRRGLDARVKPAHEGINCEKEKMASLLLSFAVQSLGAAFGLVGAVVAGERSASCVLEFKSPPAPGNLFRSIVSDAPFWPQRVAFEFRIPPG